MTDDLDEIFGITPEGTKYCRICDQYKPFSEFSKDATKKDGLTYRCKECYKVYHNENANTINARRKVHHSKYKDRAKEYHKKWYAENFDKVRNKHLTAKYGVTVQEFYALIEAQNGKCKICTNDLVVGKHTHLDHDHKTNKVRGVLCQKCNTKLGWYEKNAEKVDKYLTEDASEVDVKLLIPSYAFLH